MKTAFITGATSGFGRAIAFRFAGLGYNLVVTGRREERLNELINQLHTDFKVETLPLCFDIRDNEACINAFHSLPEYFQHIDILVNNAGLAAGASPFQDSDLADYEQMIDTNVKGLLYVSRLVTPRMVARKAGHIINLSSIAGHEVYANGAAYCASKHAVMAITKTMRIELLPYGIKVSSISPGMVDTEFSTVRFKGDKEKADNVYKGLTPLYAIDIAEAVLFMATRPTHVNIDELIIMPTDQASARDFHRS